MMANIIFGKRKWLIIKKKKIIQKYTVTVKIKVVDFDSRSIIEKVFVIVSEKLELRYIRLRTVIICILLNARCKGI